MISHCSAMNLRTFKMDPSQPVCGALAEGSSPLLGGRSRALAWGLRPGGSGSPLVTTIRGEVLVAVVVLSQQHRRRKDMVLGLCS